MRPLCAPQKLPMQIFAYIFKFAANFNKISIENVKLNCDKNIKVRRKFFMNLICLNLNIFSTKASNASNSDVQQCFDVVLLFGSCATPTCYMTFHETHNKQ